MTVVVSKVPLLVKIALAREVADDWSSIEISNNLNSLSPLLNLNESLFGNKNEPSTLPFASVTIVVLPLGCTVVPLYWFPT